MSRISTAVRFPGARGAQLAARLDLPGAQAPRAFVLFAHCFTCSKDTRATTFIAEALADAGLATLRFDFTGLGGSEGEFANTDFSSNVADLVAAARWLEAEHRAPALLVGHSLGGTAVLVAAAQIPSAAAVVTINAPSDPAHLGKLFMQQADEIREKGAAEVDLAGRTFTIRREFLDDIAMQKVAAAVAGLKRALLVMHAPADTEVSVDHASAIFLAAKHPKSFVSLATADHLLTKREDAHYAASVLAAWAGRYLPAAPAQADDVEGPRDTVLVTETLVGKFQQRIAIGPHRLIADEPPGVGGADSGPSPYDLLVAGLGACTTMTVRMYADAKGIPLERVSVALKHAKVHATDCTDCETKDGKIDRIERVLTLEGNLDDATRAKLLEIANKCPVHRTLHSEMWIPTRLAD
ncbi:MAG: alpha/beta fold hydrolase [Burkholderiales bacterium]